MHDYTFHLIANAHLDPVWLWDWREGMNEGIITCRTILELMDEDPDFTFIRGEAAIYEHIERHDPATFARIRKQVKAGRWDVVGGTYIQPDTNLPATETFCRHYLRGQRYFKEKFGKPVRVAWAADSFGHAAGLPEVMAAAGIESFAFTRPFPRDLPIAKPVFWWQGFSGGSRVLAYRPAAGWYGSERDETPRRLDAYLTEAPKHGLHHIGCFYGLGNHGGGSTRRMLADIRNWAEQHPNVRVIHSGLHRFFDAVRQELAQKGDDFVPTQTGELNFVLRGCYASIAKFKFAYRAAESLLQRAERFSTAAAMLTRAPKPDLAAAWDALLFNSFHDILPGSSIERAMNEQVAQLGFIEHNAHTAELAAMNRLASEIDTMFPKPTRPDDPASVAMLLFNPHPHAYEGYVELEANLDYRPIEAYEGRPEQLPVEVLGPNRKPVPFQLVDTEHAFSPRSAWRKRAVVRVSLPAFGWAVHAIGYRESPKRLATKDKPATAP